VKNNMKLNIRQKKEYEQLKKLGWSTKKVLKEIKK